MATARATRGGMLSPRVPTIGAMSGDFAEWLRARTDEQLRALVAVRPELITPVPAHVTGLAARATTPSATGRALDRIDRFRLAVAETLAVLPEPQTQAALRGRLAPATSAPATSGSGSGSGSTEPADGTEGKPAGSAGSEPGGAEGKPTDGAGGTRGGGAGTKPGGGAGSKLGSALREAVEGLRGMGLVYGSDSALRLAPGVREALEPPAGLGPPAEGR